jgi:uncharacterized membrane-anchored protein YitT (DUF2179 family)
MISKKDLVAFVISFVGITVLALSITCISWRYTLVTSGLPGYALILNYKTHFSVGTALFIANTLILLATLVFAGKSAGIKGLLGYTYLSFVIDSAKKIFHLTQTVLPSLPVNIALYIAQGAIAACAIGFVVHNKYSFGSYSSLLPITDKYLKISPPVLFFLLDFILTLITAYFFGMQKGLFLLVNAGAFFASFNYTLKFLQKK